MPQVTAECSELSNSVHVRFRRARLASFRSGHFRQQHRLCCFLSPPLVASVITQSHKHDETFCIRGEKPDNTYCGVFLTLKPIHVLSISILTNGTTSVRCPSASILNSSSGARQCPEVCNWRVYSCHPACIIVVKKMERILVVPSHHTVDRISRHDGLRRKLGEDSDTCVEGRDYRGSGL